MNSNQQLTVTINLGNKKVYTYYAKSITKSKNFLSQTKRVPLSILITKNAKNTKLKLYASCLMAQQLRRRYHIRAEFTRQLHFRRTWSWCGKIIIGRQRSPAWVETSKIWATSTFVLNQLFMWDGDTAEFTGYFQFRWGVTTVTWRLRGRA